MIDVSRSFSTVMGNVIVVIVLMSLQTVTVVIQTGLTVILMSYTQKVFISAIFPKKLRNAAGKPEFCEFHG